MSLESKLYADIKNNVKQKLKAMKFQAGKEPSLNLILNLIGKCPESDWWPEKSCSIWWARELRFEFRGNVIKKTNMRTTAAQKFLDYISWLETHFETHAELSFDLDPIIGSRNRHYRNINLCRSEAKCGHWKCHNSRN